MIKNKSLCAILMSIIIFNTNIFADTYIYDSLLNKLMSNNKKYLESIENEKISKIELTADKFKWIPKVNLFASESVSGYVDDSTIVSSSNIQTSVEQRLPLGMKLVLFGNQTEDIFFTDNVKYAYNFSTGANLNIPMLFMAPSLYKDLLKYEFSNNKLNRKLFNLTNRILKQSLVASSVSTIGDYAILEAFIKIDEQQKKLVEISQQTDELLWKQGKISTLQLNNNTELKHAELNTMLNRNFNFKLQKEKLLNLGLSVDDVPNNIEDWIINWESVLYATELDYNIYTDIQALQEELNWQQQVNTVSKQVPSLLLKCNFTPKAKDEQYSKFADSITQTFHKDATWKWSVSAGVNISLDPFRKEYSLNKQLKAQKSIHHLKKEILNDEIHSQKITVENNLYAYNEAIRNYKKAYELNKLRYNTAGEMYKNNTLSELDYKRQALETEKSKLNWLKARLDLLIFKLKFYNPN